MTSAGAPESADQDCECKVGRVASRYGLAELATDLGRRWQGHTGEQSSLRELATALNRRVLGAAMADAGLSPVDGEVANAHRVLTDDDVSSGVRTELRNRLAREGVDVEAVEAAFVSHGTVHSHLRDCLGLAAPTATGPPDERRDRAADTVAALRNRTAAVTRNSLERLRDDDAMALSGFDVLVEVTVTCEACGRVHTAGSLLDAGGCRCRQE